MITRTCHFKERLKERLARCGILFSEVEDDLNYLLGLPYEVNKSYAVKVKDIERFIGESGPYRTREESNGSVLWAIVRDCRLITFLLRRTNQPSTAAALRVDEVIL